MALLCSALSMAQPASAPARESRGEAKALPRHIDLSGQWRFGTDKSMTDMIQLPGSMPQRMKGNAPDTKTRWVVQEYPHLKAYKQRLISCHMTHIHQDFPTA